MGWKSEIPVAEAHAAMGVEEQLLDERRSNVLPSTAGASGGTWLGPSARKGLSGPGQRSRGSGLRGHVVVLMKKNRRNHDG